MRSLTVSFLYFSLVATPLLTGCAALDQLAYQPTRLQGVKLDLEKVKLLKLGATKQEVKNLLGSPLVLNLFKENEWFFYDQTIRKNQPPERMALLIQFDETDRVAHISTNQPKLRNNWIAQGMDAKDISLMG